MAGIRQKRPPATGHAVFGPSCPCAPAAVPAGLRNPLPGDDPTVTPIRIHLGPMPAMLRTIIGDLLGHERDLLVVGSSVTGQDVLRRAQDDRADVLITHDRDGDEGRCLERILSSSSLSILAISADGHRADAVDLVRRPVDLDGDRRSRLAEAVREITAHRGQAGEAWGRRRPA